MRFCYLEITRYTYRGAPLADARNNPKPLLTPDITLHSIGIANALTLTQGRRQKKILGGSNLAPKALVRAEGAHRGAKGAEGVGCGEGCPLPTENF